MTDDQGIAIAMEYVILLGISLLIFTAIFVGLGSFSGTAMADARSEAAYRVAALASQRMSGEIEGQVMVVEDIDLPERICGQSYLVYPSGDGREVYVLAGRETYEAPVIAPGDVKARGFIISTSNMRRIGYDSTSRTLTLT